MVHQIETKLYERTGSLLNNIMSEHAPKLIAENKAKHARWEDARVLDLGN